MDAMRILCGLPARGATAAWTVRNTSDHVIYLKIEGDGGAQGRLELSGGGHPQVLPFGAGGTGFVNPGEAVTLTAVPADGRLRGTFRLSAFAAGPLIVTVERDARGDVSFTPARMPGGAGAAWQVTDGTITLAPPVARASSF